MEINKGGVFILAIIFLFAYRLGATEPTGTELNAYVDGTVWEMVEKIDKDKGVYDALTYFIDGSQTTNGKEYLKMFSLRSVKKLGSDKVLLSEAAPRYRGGVRNDGGRIYFMPPKLNREFLIFDFTLNPSEEAYIYPYLDSENPIPIPERVKCDALKEFVVGGCNVKLYTISDSRNPNDPNNKYYDFYNYYKWKGGIGSSAGPLAPIYASFLGAESISLRRVTVKGKVVYQRSFE